VPSVQPYLDGAFANAIPLRAGSGTRIKILEAGRRRAGGRLANCRRRIGLMKTNEISWLAEEPGQFARRWCSCGATAGVAQKLIHEARRTVRPFTPEHIAKTVAVLRRALRRRGDGQCTLV